jgi:hypothetical protein
LELDLSRVSILLEVSSVGSRSSHEIELS